MIRRILVAFALALVAAPAFADTIDALFKNTLTLTDSRGGVYTLLVSEGGQMEQTNSAGAWASGAWDMEAGRFCWTARGAAKLCIPLETGKDVGDSWEIKGPTGKPVWTAAIVEGRAKLKEDQQ